MFPKDRANQPRLFCTQAYYVVLAILLVKSIGILVCSRNCHVTLFYYTTAKKRRNYGDDDDDDDERRCVDDTYLFYSFFNV